MKRILAPVDFSEASLSAAKYAATLAKMAKADVYLLNVFHLPNPLVTLPIELVITLDELKSGTDSALKEMAEKVAAGTGLEREKIQIASRNGFTQEEIESFARYIHADLIVLGMKPATTTREFLTGSITADLISKSTYPLIIIPESASLKETDHIIFASDEAGIKDGKGWRILLELQKLFEADMDIIHVSEIADTATQEKLINKSEGLLNGIPHTYSFPKSAEVIGTLENVLRSVSTGLLVMGHNRHGWLSRMTGKDHSRKMAFHSEVPLMIMNS